MPRKQKNKKETAAAYREKNRERLLEKQKARYRANPAKYIARASAWNKQNPERRAQILMESRERNIEKQRAKCKGFMREKRRLELEAEMLSVAGKLTSAIHGD